MLTTLMIVAFLLVPAVVMGIYFARSFKTGTPSLQFPVLAPLINLQYRPDPPRMAGEWHGTGILFEALKAGGVRATAALSRPSRLRVEIGPRELVMRRAGVIVPDPVPTGDAAFEERFLARCSDKSAGPAIVDSAMRQRLLAQRDVEILGEGDAVHWLLPELRDPDTAETVMDILHGVAAVMENYPRQDHA